MKQAFALCAIMGLLSSCSSSTPDVKEKRGEIYLNAGIESLQQGEFTDALISLKEASKLTPKSVVVWTNLGIAYAGKEDYVKAEDSWKKALAIDPNFGDAHTAYGATLMRLRRYGEAEKQLKAAASDLTYLNAAQAKYNLALLYSETNKPLLSEQMLKLAVKDNSGFCPAWFKLGQIQKDRGDYAEAVKSFKQAAGGACFRNPQAHYELGSLYLKAKEPALAKSKLLEVIQFFPQSDWARQAEVTLNMMR